MRGRKPSTIPMLEKKISIPLELATQVDLILLDPIAQKPRYGAWAELLTALLTKWLAEQRRDLRPPSGD